MIYILIGPSCSGKTTIGNKSGLPELISHTSRERREGEKEGKTYYYVSKEEIRNMDKVEETEYDGNLYCLATKEIEKKTEKHDSVFVIMDREGVEQMKEQYGDRVTVIFIEVPPLQIARRLYKRDGFFGMIKRMWHAYKTGEFSNDDIADFVIPNFDEHQKKAIELFQNIVTFNTKQELSEKIEKVGEMLENVKQSSGA